MWLFWVAFGAGPSWASAGPDGNYEVRYHSRAEVDELISSWVAASGGAARRIEVSQGVVGIEFGGGDQIAAPLEKRRTLLLIGGLDGRSTAGGEAVLKSCARLLADVASLRPDLSIVAIPWAVPDRLQSVDQGEPTLGRDLDGDGLVLEMLVEDAQGPWTPSVDRRFLVEARPGDAPRYQRQVEGEPTNQRANGGPDAMFPVMGGQPLTGIPEPDALAAWLQTLVLSRPMAAVCVFQGNHGGLALPGAGEVFAEDELPDQATYERLGRALAQATGRSEVPVQSLRAARRRASAGSFVDWCYQVPGVLAFEVAPWGNLPNYPEPAPRSDEPGLTDPWSMRPPLTGRDLDWARWLDDQCGGLGFVEWRPVDRGDAPSCLVGGWKPRTYWNPPEAELAKALAGMDEFVAQLIEHQSKLELCDVALERDGDLCILRARLRCQGSLPLRTKVYGRWPGLQAEDAPWLALELPASAQRLAGPGRYRFACLDPGAKSTTLEWLVYAPSGTRLTLRFGWRQAALGQKELTL